MLNLTHPTVLCDRINQDPAELPPAGIPKALQRFDGVNHGLRTPNEGINQRNLKIWAEMADKICFGRT